MFEISTRSATHRQMEQNGDTRALVERIAGFTAERRRKRVMWK